MLVVLEAFEVCRLVLNREMWRLLELVQLEVLLKLLQPQLSQLVLALLLQHEDKKQASLDAPSVFLQVR